MLSNVHFSLSFFLSQFGCEFQHAHFHFILSLDVAVNEEMAEMLSTLQRQVAAKQYEANRMRFEQCSFSSYPFLFEPPSLLSPDSHPFLSL
jgi:hypothetical protein